MEWIKQIVRLIVVVLLQVLLFDHLQIAGWGFPMVYVLFLMNMPVQIPRWAEMLIGAVVGLVLAVSSIISKAAMSSISISNSCWAARKIR